MYFRDFIKEFTSHLFLPRLSNNQRSRLLHPAGLSIIVGIFLLNNSLRMLVNNIPGYVLGFASSITIDQVIEQTNQERTKAGLTTLTQNPQLTAAAFAKAQDMFSKDYWAHVSPTGTQPWSFIKNQGYSYQYAGENLARDFSNSSEMMNAWMGSASHRENILNAKYREIGIAVVDGTLEGIETRLVVQMLAVGTSTPVAQTKPQTPPTVEKPVVEEITEELFVEETEITDNIPIELEETDFGKTPVQEPQPQYAGTSLLETHEISTKGMNVISPKLITQTFGIILVALIIGTLTLDWVVSHKKKAVRLVGKNWAHLTFLGIFVLMLLQIAQGRIL